MEKVRMVECPNCGKTLSKPDKFLKNSAFQIDAYTCDRCGHRFKVTNELFGIEIMLNPELLECKQ